MDLFGVHYCERYKKNVSSCTEHIPILTYAKNRRKYGKEYPVKCKYLSNKMKCLFKGNRKKEE